MYDDIKLILDKEQYRQDTTIELIASENYASQAVMDLCGSIFTNKYAEGYPGKRYYNGCEYMDDIEDLAIKKVTELYKCEFANVQPHSGVNANTAVYQAFMTPGSTILGMDLASGGHLSHGAPPTLSGKVYRSITYGVHEDGYIDYDQVEKFAALHKPQVIVAGASAIAAGSGTTGVLGSVSSAVTSDIVSDGVTPLIAPTPEITPPPIVESTGADPVASTHAGSAG